MTDGCDISGEIALRLTSPDDMSTLFQVMAWCRQATSHYLNQCWPWSLPLYGITKPQWVKHCGAETGIFRSCWVNSMATDALAFHLTWSLITMVLNMQDAQFLVFHRGRFKLSVPSQCWEIIKKMEIYFYISWNKSSTTGVKIISFKLLQSKIHLLFLTLTLWPLIDSCPLWGDFH